MKKFSKAIFVLKILLFTYLISFILLGILALIVYKTSCNDKIVFRGIILIYFLSTFLGGMSAGKIKKSKRLIWGAAIGAAYVIVLVVVSVIMGNAGIKESEIIVASIASLAGGMIGGMLS